MFYSRLPCLKIRKAKGEGDYFFPWAVDLCKQIFRHWLDFTLLSLDEREVKILTQKFFYPVHINSEIWNEHLFWGEEFQVFIWLDEWHFV